jgi:hypothetical protein
MSLSQVRLCSGILAEERFGSRAIGIVVEYQKRSVLGKVSCGSVAVTLRAFTSLDSM